MIKRLLQIAVMTAITLTAAAQNSTMSPYSRYGYGLLNDNASSMQRAMGGVGYAMNSGRQINVMNPASYAAIDSLTFLFDMGISADWLWAHEGDSHEDRMSGGLDYVTMSFPLSKRIGASLGLLPYSSTGYAFSQKIGNGSAKRSGSGSINEAYLGVGINPVADLYIGANVSYMFGTVLNDLYAYTVTGSTSLFQRYIRVRDWRVDIGVQYPINISPTQRVTLGATYSPGKGLRGETYGLYYDANATNKADTVGPTNLKGKYSLPSSYGVGLNYSWRDKLMVEADFTYQPWRDAKYTPIENFETSEFDDRWKAAFGVQYVPQPRGGYWGRVQLRAGAYYTHDYQMIRGNNLREYGLTLGVGLPVPGFKTMVNLGVQYKHRQAAPDPLIKEQYLTVTLGINVNEMWFRKSQIY